MAVTTTIPWEDGSGDNLYFTADAMEGNQEVLVSSDANAGDERTKTVTFSAQGAEPKSLGVIQLGSGTPSREFDDWLKDGDTHLWVEIVNDYQKEQQIRIKMKGTIDWGDGSAKDTADVTAYTTFSHTYTGLGRYRIDLHPTSGTFELGGGSNAYNVMGNRTNNTYFRTSVLYQAEIGSDIITTLTQYAFYSCSGLRKVYIPKSITSAGGNVFNSATALAKIEFEDATKLSSATSTSFFLSCQNLQDIGGMSPNWGTTLDGVIRACSCLMEFTIPSNVTNIATVTFANTYGLKDLWVYPASPPTVANANAFTGMNSGVVIHVPNGKLSSYQSASIWSTYASKMVEMPASS